MVYEFSRMKLRLHLFFVVYPYWRLGHSSRQEPGRASVSLLRLAHGRATTILRFGICLTILILPNAGFN